MEPISAAKADEERPASSTEAITHRELAEHGYADQLHRKHLRAEVGQQIHADEGHHRPDEEVGDHDDGDGVQPRPLGLTDPGGPADAAGTPHGLDHGGHEPTQEGQGQHGLAAEVIDPATDLGEGAHEGAGAFRRRGALALQQLDHVVDAARLGTILPLALGQSPAGRLDQGQGAGGVETAQIGGVDAGDLAPFQIAAQFRRQPAERGRGPVAGQAQPRRAVRLHDLVLRLVHRTSNDRSDIAIIPWPPRRAAEIPAALMVKAASDVNAR